MKFQKKHCVAMLLAGGQGSRLQILTRDTAKPAVSFGGKYRIIDFPLSNCVNSGIDTVGILTQYQPLELNAYIGNGQPWNLNRAHGGAQILPPYMKSRRSRWYEGTADAIYQNFSFLQRYEPEHVLILSGDHIYQMRYDHMLAYHEAAGADCTIAVRRVPMEEASRFGIVITDEAGRICQFEEKPENPKSDMASMGIYIFRWQLLRQALEEDAGAPDSSHDFGKDVLPKLLGEGANLSAYLFDGYWRDVGTIESLWQANMDLLGQEPVFSLPSGGQSRIYSRNDAYDCTFFGKDAMLRESMVAEGCQVEGSVEHSVISTGCRVEAGAQVSCSVLMPGAVVKSGAQITHAIVAEDATVAAGTQVGKVPKQGSAARIAVVGRDMPMMDQTHKKGAQ